MESVGYIPYLMRPSRFRHADTTASSLYFSETVKRVKNKATVNENVAGENIDSLKKEILRLHDVVRNIKGLNT